MPAECLRKMTIIDAPGFSATDLHHMQVLKKCLETKCNALVHVVSNKATPDDCRSILEDSGM